MWSTCNLFVNLTLQLNYPRYKKYNKISLPGPQLLTKPINPHFHTYINAFSQIELRVGIPLAGRLSAAPISATPYVTGYPSRSPVAKVTVCFG